MHIMPSQAESIAGVRFQVQDVSATENARRMLETIALKEEILQATRRTKVHTSMLEYTEHAQKIKKNRINLDKLRQKSHRGLVSHPVMQFDNTLALSSFPPSAFQPPNHLHPLNERVPIRTYNNKTRINLSALKNIKWVPETTLSHFSVTPQTEKQHKVRKIAVLKSNDEIVYANYNVSSSSYTAEGEQTATGETAAATESLLYDDVAEGDEYIQIRGNQNDVKTVAGTANIRLRQPDTFHPGILPRPGQVGTRKLTPRFTLDITLPRMDPDEVAAPCPSPCSQEGESQDDENENENEQKVRTDDLTKQKNRDSKQQHLGGCCQQQINTTSDEQVTVRSCPQCLAKMSNVSKAQTKATNDTNRVTDPHNLPSTLGKSASNDQTPPQRKRAVTFKSGIKSKEGQKRRYNLRRSRSLMAAGNINNVPETSFLEKYRKCNVTEITLGEDHNNVLLTDTQKNQVAPHSSIPQSDGMTLRSILKISPNESSKKDGATLIESTSISSLYPKSKREKQFKIQMGSKAKQTTQKDVKREQYSKDNMKKREKDSPVKVKIQDDFIDKLAPDSYNKSYIVNTQPLPTHMKRILENAMASVPKLDREQSLQNVTENEKSKIDVNQACEILDNLSEHTRQRDNGKVCRHGMFLANCSVCKALVEIQQRLKFNIKKHVQDKFHWNLLPRMQYNGEIKWPITSDSAGTVVSNVEKKSFRLPGLKSTITMAELRTLRRKKRGNNDNTSIPEQEAMQPPPVQTITFNGGSEVEELDHNADNELSSPRRKKKVTFAEHNIYRQMVGYKV
ncbi:uncharacterized protein [Amphiura filiformis]|uniref:uncharacterized protein n=1 Tax=Amphiura filiformis TaxID=82378 RepID=UPI003B21EA9B